MHLQVLAGLLTFSQITSVFAHGKLTRPTPRDGISTGRAGLDENNPVSFEPGCTQENTCDAFVCREPVPNPNVVPANVVAGGQLDVAWSFTALHVGDCAVYISYDVEKPRNQQRFVKIANLPDCKSYTSKNIKIPAVLPAGRAILRWDWVALHIWPTPELFVQCADIVIDSSSQVSPTDLDSFPITNPPIYPADGNDGVGYRNAWDTGASQSMTGPSCIDNTINDCILTAPGTERNTDSRRGSVMTPTLPTPPPNPTSAPQPQSQPSPTTAPTPVPYATAAPQPQYQPSSQPTPEKQCVSNHPTIDYSLSCKALVATCNMHSFCKLVSTDGVGPEPEREPEAKPTPEMQCVSVHPTIDYSLSCKALVATCEMHSFCKLVAPDGVGPEPALGEGANAEPEPESEQESEAERESEGEVEAEPESEAEQESEGEVEAEAELESEQESKAESESEGEAEAEPEPESEQESEAERESEGEVEAEPEPELEQESEAERESEGEAETKLEAEPERESDAKPEPEPTSAPCLPIGNCGAYDWCDQAEYEAWCQSEGRALRCPVLFCKTAANSVLLVQRKHLRSAKHRSQTVLGSSFIQHLSNVATPESVCLPEM